MDDYLAANYCSRPFLPFLQPYRKFDRPAVLLFKGSCARTFIVARILNVGGFRMYT